MPFVYWRNLVLGDPHARAVRQAAGGHDDRAVGLGVGRAARHRDGQGLAGSGIAKIQLFVDGKLLAEGPGDTLEACVPVHAGTTSQILAVAQNAVGTGALAKFPPKGWTSVSLSGTAEGVVCASAADGGTDDGGILPPMAPQDSGAGCSCRSATGTREARGASGWRSASSSSFAVAYGT